MRPSSESKKKNLKVSVGSQSTVSPLSLPSPLFERMMHTAEGHNIYSIDFPVWSPKCNH
jgi:hypothetical protein